MPCLPWWFNWHIANSVLVQYKLYGLWQGLIFLLSSQLNHAYQNAIKYSSYFTFNSWEYICIYKVRTKDNERDMLQCTLKRLLGKAWLEANHLKIKIYISLWTQILTLVANLFLTHRIVKMQLYIYWIYYYYIPLKTFVQMGITYRCSDMNQ